MFVMHLVKLGFALAATVAAQVGPQAELLPACIKKCDPAAIASVNCTNADQYCHCVKQTGIIANITPCADIECANPSQSMHTFTTLFGDVCSKFNISVPVIGTDCAANGTTVSYNGSTIIYNSSTAGVTYSAGAANFTNITASAPSPTISIMPYTGSAQSLMTGQSGILITGALMFASFWAGLGLDY